MLWFAARSIERVEKQPEAERQPPRTWVTVMTWILLAVFWIGGGYLIGGLGFAIFMAVISPPSREDCSPSACSPSAPVPAFLATAGAVARDRLEQAAAA